MSALTAENSGSNVTIGSTSTVVLAKSGYRVFKRTATITNDSDETMYFSLGGVAELNKGIRLNAGGGTMVTGFYTGVISAICASGGKNLCLAVE